MTLKLSKMNITQLTKHLEQIKNDLENGKSNVAKLEEEKRECEHTISKKREQGRKNMRNYYRTNQKYRERLKEKRQNRHTPHKTADLSAYMVDYYQKHKAQRLEKVNCDKCGRNVTAGNLKSHQKRSICVNHQTETV